MNALAPLVALLTVLAEKFLPRGTQQAREPSTVIGLAELSAVLGGLCAHFGLAPEWAEPVALAVLGVAGAVNVYRREHPPAPIAK